MPNFAEIQTEIAAMLDIPDEELSDEQRQVMEDYLEELGVAEAAKVDGFAQFIRLETASAEAMKEESKRLAAKAKTKENRVAYLKGRYMDTMQEHDLKKVAGNSYTLSVRASESVSVTAMVDSLPPEYVCEKVSREPDKTAIKTDLKAGKTIPGCELATTYSLQIR